MVHAPQQLPGAASARGIGDIDGDGSGGGGGGVGRREAPQELPQRHCSVALFRPLSHGGRAGAPQRRERAHLVRCGGGSGSGRGAVPEELQHRVRRSEAELSERASERAAERRVRALRHRSLLLLTSISIIIGVVLVRRRWRLSRHYTLEQRSQAGAVRTAAAAARHEKRGHRGRGHRLVFAAAAAAATG